MTKVAARKLMALLSLTAFLYLPDEVLVLLRVLVPALVAPPVHHVLRLALLLKGHFIRKLYIEDG